MAERPVDQLTLREMFTGAEALLRDLEDHLRNSFLTRFREIQELAGSYTQVELCESIPDRTIRHHVAELLGSDDYAESLIKKLDQYLAAIAVRSQEAIESK